MKLRLQREQLTELTTDDLAAVAAGAAIPPLTGTGPCPTIHQCPTLPVADCVVIHGPNLGTVKTTFTLTKCPTNPTCYCPQP